MSKSSPRRAQAPGPPDILVVGGGSAGVMAAVAAARSGAKVRLLERYPRLGGMATGGLVLLFDDMADATSRTVDGLALECVERLVAVGGAVVPPAELWFTSSAQASRQWAHWGFEDQYARTKPKPITYAAAVDPEALTFVLMEMALEAGVEVRLGELGTDVLLDDGGRSVRGVATWSKEGRREHVAAMTIDASGDGDIMASAGARHTVGRYLMTLAHRLGNVDVDRYLQWEEDSPAEASRTNRAMRDIYGGSWSSWWLRTPLDGVVWCNCPHFPSLDGLSTDDQSHVVIEGLRRIHRAIAFARANVPGFERAVLIETASQVGVRQTRLLQGEYVLTKDDVLTGRWFEDRIARGRDYYYPYRALVPIDVDSLLIAGRCFSATPEAQKISREIPPMMAVGQAAGIAAVLSLDSRNLPRAVDVPELQRRLRTAGANLGPDVDPGLVRQRTDPFAPPVPVFADHGD